MLNLFFINVKKYLLLFADHFVNLICLWIEYDYSYVEFFHWVFFFIYENWEKIWWEMA